MAKGEGYNQTKAFSYLNKISNEKPLQVKEILRVIKGLDKRENFLDVGAGTGDIFLTITKSFKKSIAIEPGEKTFNILQRRAKRYKTNFEIIKKNWQDFYKENKKKYNSSFDLITGIHIAYFFPDLKKLINEMLEFLSPNGRLVFVCAYGENQEKDFVHYLRNKITGAIFMPNPPFAGLKKLFPKNCIVDKKLNCTFTFNNLDLLESGRHLSKDNEPTNYFLQFTLKKWFDELTEKDKRIIKNFLVDYKTIDGKEYVVPSLQRFYVFKK